MHDQTRGSVDQQLREVQLTAQHQLSLSPTTIDMSHANSRDEFDAVAAMTAHLRQSAGTATHSGPTPLNQQPCHLATATTDGIVRPGSRFAHPTMTALSLPGIPRTSSAPPVQTQGLAAVLARVDNTMSHGTVHPRKQQQQQQQQHQQHGAKPKLDAVLRRKSSKDRAPASTDGAVPSSPISVGTPMSPGKCGALPPQGAQSAASFEAGRTSTKAAATGFKGPPELQQQPQQPSSLQTGQLQPQQQQSWSQQEQQQQQRSGHACTSLRLLPTETPLHSDCVRPDSVLQHCGHSISEAKDACDYREAQGVINMMAALTGKLAAVCTNCLHACRRPPCLLRHAQPVMITLLGLIPMTLWLRSGRSASAAQGCRKTAGRKSRP